MQLSKTKKTVPTSELFATEPKHTAFPELEYDRNEDALDEIKILGFPFRSPFTLLKRSYEGLTLAEELPRQIGNVVYIVGYYVNIKKVNTVTGETMYFGSFIDHTGRLFDTVHFPQVIERTPFQGWGCYLLKGVVIADFDVPSIEVSHMQKMEWAF